MATRHDPDDLGHLAVSLATGAGELALRRREERFDVDSKSTRTDLVTDVDRAVEAWLIDAIGQVRPDDAVLGEEGGGRPGDSGVRWIVDPIDGTVNFVLGLPQWAVSVAAERDGVVVAGCVYNPNTGEQYRATLGAGAFLGDRALHGPRDVPVARCVVGTGFGYDARRRARQAAVIAELLPQVADIRRLGAASLDLCAVAAGRLDAYFEVGLNPWDWAAGLLIAHEAGCVSSGLHGREAGGDFTAVAGPGAASDFFELLSRLRADEV